MCEFNLIEAKARAETPALVDPSDTPQLEHVHCSDSSGTDSEVAQIVDSLSGGDHLPAQSQAETARARCRQVGAQM